VFVVRAPFPGTLLCLLEMQWDRIDEIYEVSFFSQWKCICAGSATDVENHSWRRRKKTIEQIESPKPFPGEERDLQPIGFLAQIIIATNLGFHFRTSVAVRGSLVVACRFVSL
jgi:hypothetical protein